MKAIGFIGLGTMGRHMAANLLKEGHDLTVYNRTAERMEDLRRLGADAAPSAADAAKSADVLFTMLSNDEAVESVYFGAGGIAESVQPGSVVFDCSTVSPALSRRIADALSQRYARFLDAPVSGSEPAAAAASLVFMAGGDRRVFEEHRELLGCMGSRCFHMGPAGSGSEAKLALNAILAMNMLSLSEGIVMASAAGLHLPDFLEIVKSGGAASKLAEIKGDKILKGDYASQFSTELMLKDLNLAAELGRRLNLPLPGLSAARDAFQSSVNIGLGSADMSAVVRAVAERGPHRDRLFDPSSPPADSAADAKSRGALEAGGGEGRSAEAQAAPERAGGAERRRSERIPLHIPLQLSVHQWLQEGAFSGQTMAAILHDLSESGLQIAMDDPLAQDMFVVIHFPEEADLPPITGRIIRIERHGGGFRYGCLLSGIPLVTRLKLEHYLQLKKTQLTRA